MEGKTLQTAKSFIRAARERLQVFLIALDDIWRTVVEAFFFLVAGDPEPARDCARSDRRTRD